MTRTHGLGHLNMQHVACCVYRTLPAISRRQAPVRLQLDSRDQARRLPAHGPGDPVGIRLITRRGNDWTRRYPLLVEAVNHLKVRSCLIDGEVSPATATASQCSSACGEPAGPEVML